MKQLLFLLLFPCLALAQYTGNGNQKITLGEQTTADGLVFRGVASIDTVTATSKITRANKQDTSAFLLLDTVTNLLWHYKTASNGWLQAGGGVSVSSFSAGTTGLTPSTATTGAVTLGGTLAVANGGTGQTTLAAAGINTGSGTLNYLPKYTATGTTLGNSIASDDGTTFNVNLQGKFTGLSGSRILTLNAPTNGGSLTFEAGGSAFADMGSYPSIIGGGSATDFAFNTRGSSSLTLSTAFAPRITILSGGNVGIGTASPSDKLTVSTAASGGNTGAKFVSTDNTASTNVIVDVENSAGKRLQIVGFGGSASGNFLGTTRAGNSFVVKAGGKLGIGVDDDYDLFLAAGYTSGVKTMTIEQNGGFKFSTLAGSGSRAVNADANGVITATSSILIKENVESINYGLKDVLKLNPVIFNYIDKYKWGEGKELGFIAEDVMNIIPESTGVMANSDIYFDLQKLIPVLTKAIQEQNALIKALEQRILTLENK